ncbi:hypothetical protein LR48_Vigan2375s000100 [Vigna angularis]|uniref:HMA domain-containing protein n=1 Tax=Vigna angularis var. angularis TaxID=157739 RepID=A0A0S3RJ79_PHAAN|nr:hypothetical protein LR48_Vigan2375s000100 [Vigna angularis]BAT80561.1 hypothetical protein VIGAN_03015200 [Vigna angularis var. angularis]
MKQKIVIRVSMDCEKCRKKAFKIAVNANEVSSVALEGDDKMAVTGERVDSVSLVRALRKKFRHAMIESVEEVKDKKEEKEKENEMPLAWYSYAPYPPTVACVHEYDGGCTVM